MKRFLLAVLCLVCMTAQGRAQSFPDWHQNYIPTVKEWQDWWARKLDINGDGSGLKWGNYSLPDLLDTKVDVSGGKSTGQTLTTPTISGGQSVNQTLTTPTVTNGAITAASFTCQNAAACVLSTLIQYSPSWAQATERTLLLRLEDTVSVKDFGAKGDGVTNDDAAIQNALAAICARSPNPGGELFFPAGDYVVSAATGHSIPCPGVTIRGTGGGAHQPGGSRFLVQGSGSASLFQFNAPLQGLYFYGGRVTSVAFSFANTTEAVTQTGYAVEFDHCAGCLVDHVYSWGAFNLFKAYSGFKNRFHDFYGAQMASSAALDGGYAVTFTGDYCTAGPSGCATRGDVTEIFDFHVDEMLSSDTGFVPGSCIHISGFAATTWIRNGTCNQSHIGVNIDCPSPISIGECPQFIHIDRLETEINAMTNPSGSTCLVGTDLVHLEAYSFQCFGYNKPQNLIRLSASGAFNGVGHVEFYGGKVEGAAASCVTAA
ncbi:glycosyl hydrolase family 28-related protein [Komagataeibacter kakiaceti]|uniref:glycosyl hydrolase family 28-related protein n=1 Tax=Komagataeibacter kakiaceti TaxID=943261 RepID=UPI000470210A|nr:glycosyl hydrolase family 28-related protein [Komagataeibacter kakiaceti]